MSCRRGNSSKGSSDLQTGNCQANANECCSSSSSFLKRIYFTPLQSNQETNGGYSLQGEIDIFCLTNLVNVRDLNCKIQHKPHKEQWLYKKQKIGVPPLRQLNMH